MLKIRRAVSLALLGIGLLALGYSVLSLRLTKIRHTTVAVALSAFDVLKRDMTRTNNFCLHGNQNIKHLFSHAEWKRAYDHRK